jgi:outer membrane protein
MASELVKEDWDAYAIFQRATGTLAAYTSNDLAESIARQNISLARAGFWPTLSLGGGANTTWFSSSELAQFLPSYSTQLDNNLAESVGLSLNIPLFSNGTNQAAVQSAELGLRQQEIFNEQELNLLLQTVQQAVADAEAAAGSYVASIKVVEARRLATDFAQKRFDAGQATAFEFNNARNLLQQAEADLLRSKYTFLLARKTLDFYQGKELQF